MLRLFSAVLWAGLFCSCRQDMHDQPRYTALQASAFFADGSSARPIPRGSIPFGDRDRPGVERTGIGNEGFAAAIPYPIDMAFLERGRERFEIFCAPCHGFLGDGDGMIARRGFLNPSNLHTDRVRRSPPGYLFQVISNGFGAMPEYSDQVPPRDRWAIIAYVRALELGQHAPIEELPADRRKGLL